MSFNTRTSQFISVPENNIHEASWIAFPYDFTLKLYSAGWPSSKKIQFYYICTRLTFIILLDSANSRFLVHIFALNFLKWFTNNLFHLIIHINYLLNLIDLYEITRNTFVKMYLHFKVCTTVWIKPILSKVFKNR